MSYVISIINQKGGTAKTTTAIQLGARLAFLKKKVLMIDMDPQFNATLNLGIDASMIEGSLYDILVRGKKMKDVIHATSIENLHLLPSRVSLANIDLNLANQARKQFQLSDALESVKDLYDFILIDCPPSLSLLPVSALVASKSAIIPVVAQYFSLEGLKQINTLINSIQLELNPNLKILGILFCMVDFSLRTTEPSIAMVKDHFQDKVFKTCIRYCSKLNEASIVGQSIFDYDAESVGATDYAAFSNEVIERVRRNGP